MSCYGVPPPPRFNLAVALANRHGLGPTFPCDPGGFLAFKILGLAFTNESDNPLVNEDLPAVEHRQLAHVRGVRHSRLGVIPPRRARNCSNGCHRPFLSSLCIVRYK